MIFTFALEKSRKLATRPTGHGLRAEDERLLANQSKKTTLTNLINADRVLNPHFSHL